MRRFAAAHLSESSPKGSLDSDVTRRGSAPTAGGPGAERPDSPVPHLRLGLSHPADPLLNPADLGEGLGSFHLLCLVDQLAVHRACSFRTWIREGLRPAPRRRRSTVRLAPEPVARSLCRLGPRAALSAAGRRLAAGSGRGDTWPAGSRASKARTASSAVTARSASS